MESQAPLKIPAGTGVSPLDGPVVCQSQVQTIEQTMEKLPGGARRLAAQLRTPADRQSIWAVLTDYNNLSEYIPNLVQSTLLGREGNRVHLKQVGSQQFLGLRFSAEVLLDLFEELEAGKLIFKLTKGDFRRFEGSWTMKELPENQGTILIYELIVQGCIGMPVSLIEARLKEDLSLNLLSVEQAALKSQ